MKIEKSQLGISTLVLVIFIAVIAVILIGGFLPETTDTQSRSLLLRGVGFIADSLRNF